MAPNAIQTDRELTHRVLQSDILMPLTPAQRYSCSSRDWIPHCWHRVVGSTGTVLASWPHGSWTNTHRMLLAASSLEDTAWEDSPGERGCHHSPDHQWHSSDLAAVAATNASSISSPLTVAAHIPVPDTAHSDRHWQWEERLKRQKGKENINEVSVTFLQQTRLQYRAVRSSTAAWQKSVSSLSSRKIINIRQTLKSLDMEAGCWGRWNRETL